MDTQVGQITIHANNRVRVQLTGAGLLQVRGDIGELTAVLSDEQMRELGGALLAKGGGIGGAVGVQQGSRADLEAKLATAREALKRISDFGPASSPWTTACADTANEALKEIGDA